MSVHRQIEASLRMWRLRRACCVSSIPMLVWLGHVSGCASSLAKIRARSAPLLLTDLSRYSDDELRSGTLDAVTRLLFKHISNEPEALLEHIINHFDLVERTFAEPSGLKSVLLVLEYVLKASDIAEQEVVRLSRRLSSKVEKEIMTTAERLREEGWKKGLETGLEQGLEQGLERGLERGLEKGQLTGKQQILIRLLRLKFGEIGDTCTSAVEGMNEAELDNAAAHVLTAESLDELFK